MFVFTCSDAQRLGRPAPRAATPAATTTACPRPPAHAQPRGNWSAKCWPWRLWSEPLICLITRRKDGKNTSHFHIFFDRVKWVKFQGNKYLYICLTMTGVALLRSSRYRQVARKNIIFSSLMSIIGCGFGELWGLRGSVRRKLLVYYVIDLRLTAMSYDGKNSVYNFSSQNYFIILFHACSA